MRKKRDQFGDYDMNMSEITPIFLVSVTKFRLQTPSDHSF